VSVGTLLCRGFKCVCGKEHTCLFVCPLHLHTIICFVSLAPLYIGLLDMSVGTLAHRGTALSVHLLEATFVHYNVSMYVCKVFVNRKM
jgi:hypothetical protein